MNTYYMIIMERSTFQVLVILRCEGHHIPMQVLTEYAKWGGFYLPDLLYNIAPCHNFSEVLEGKNMLTRLE